MKTDYFYGDQAEQFAFYRIPKVLFADEQYRNVSVEAKVLYGILLDRMSLSKKNGWMDEEERVFIIFPVEEIMESVGCAAQKAVKLLNELESTAGLIERKRQGLGKPNLIYVKNFVEFPKSKFQNDENQNSGMMKIKTQEFRKSKCSNTDINKTDYSYTENHPIVSDEAIEYGGDTMGPDGMDRFRETVRNNIEYEYLLRDYPSSRDELAEILELITDTLCSTRSTIRIAGEERQTEVVRERFLRLNSEHIRYVLECLKENTSEIRNIKQYLLAALYNATMTVSSYYSAAANHAIHGP